MATLTLIDGGQITYTALTIVSGGSLPNTPASGESHASLTAATVIGSTGAAVNIGASTAGATYNQYADPVTATVAHVPLSRIRSAA